MSLDLKQIVHQKLIVKFCLQLTKASPVSVMLAEEAVEVINRLKEHPPDGKDLLCLQTYAPTFYVFASKMRADDCVLVRPIIDNVLECYAYLQSFRIHDTGTVVPDSPENNLEYFPSLPQQSQRGIYASDSSRSTEQPKLCEKNFAQHGSLSPGIFTMFCQHGEKTSLLCVFLSPSIIVITVLLECYVTYSAC